MSESYTAIFFPGIEKADVDAVEQRVTTALVEAGILRAEPTPERVYRPEQYAVVYGASKSIGSHHESAVEIGGLGAPIGQYGVNDGVGIRKGFGVNGLDLNNLYDMTCPACMADTQGEEAEDLAEIAANQFYHDGVIPKITCPACGTASDARDWVSSNVPAFAYLSYEFWNWPDFQVGGWTTDIPSLMSKAAGSPLRIGGAML